MICFFDFVVGLGHYLESSKGCSGMIELSEGWNYTDRSPSGEDLLPIS